MIFKILRLSTLGAHQQILFNVEILTSKYGKFQISYFSTVKINIEQNLLTETKCAKALYLKDHISRLNTSPNSVSDYWFCFMLKF
jgi:hypothetical protein